MKSEKYIDVSRTTAWRYRNRYKLCMMVKEEKKDISKIKYC